ncbi:MAG TPA: hypothetical protein VGE73_12060, partial [Pseudolabrys sp.]
DVAAAFGAGLRTADVKVDGRFILQRDISCRHGRIYSGHPRLNSIATVKTWMAGTRPAMTN